MRGDFATLVQADSYDMVTSKKKNFTAELRRRSPREEWVSERSDGVEQERPKNKQEGQEGQEAATA